MKITEKLKCEKQNKTKLKLNKQKAKTKIKTCKNDPKRK